MIGTATTQCLTDVERPCSVRGMTSLIVRAVSDPELVATERGFTAGFWFTYGYFYASPVMLAERRLRMT